MDDSQILSIFWQIFSILAAIIGSFFSIIIAMVAWNWSKLHQKVDQIVISFRKMTDEIKDQLSDHHAQLTEHKVRLSQLEKHHEKCKRDP